jgi:hypothetical protein
MITDAFLQLDASNASIRGANTYVSQNTIDLSQNREVGSGEPAKILYNVEVAFAGGTQVTAQIITSANANLSTPTVIGQSAPIVTAALVLGALFAQYIPEVLSPMNAAVAGQIGGVGSTGQRYLGVQYVSTGTYTAGTISSRVVVDTVDVKFYPVGYTIL